MSRVAGAALLLLLGACGPSLPSDFYTFVVDEVPPDADRLVVNMALDDRTTQPETFALAPGHGSSVSLGLAFPNAAVVQLRFEAYRGDCIIAGLFYFLRGIVPGRQQADPRPKLTMLAVPGCVTLPPAGMTFVPEGEFLFGSNNVRATTSAF